MISNNTLIRDPEGGASQTGLRDRNARVVLSYVRRHEALPSAEIARRSGLSAQTVSNIIRALEADGLLIRREAVKGKVGKPSVPVALNPKGVYSLGLNIGRRSSELVLVDFSGQPVQSCTTSYAYPVIEDVFDFVATGMARIFKAQPGTRKLVAGLGVARPNNLWKWLENVNAPNDAMHRWQTLDIGKAISEQTGLTAYIENDATSASVAEHLVGRGSEFTDFAHIFIGAFVGGGLVLNGKVISGRTGNAAGLGPLPVPDEDGGTTQLLNVASLYTLEHALEASGCDPFELRRNSDSWAEFETHVAPWIDRTSGYLAIAAAAIASVVEVEAVLIDGAMPDDVRHRLTEGTARKFRELDVTGIETLRIEEAEAGRGARSTGAALLPIMAKYFVA